MRPQDVTPEVIGKKVACYAYGTNDVLGTIVGIIDNENRIGVRIVFDEPLTYYFEYQRKEATELDATKSKHGCLNDLQFVEFVTEGWQKPIRWGGYSCAPFPFTC